jgi:hypothetical protein
VHGLHHLANAEQLLADLSAMSIHNEPPTYSAATLRWLCAALVLATPGIAAHAAEPEVVPADQPPFRAELAAIDADWTLRFAGKKPRELPATQLVTWGQFVEPHGGRYRPSWIVLADGGLIVADLVGLEKQKLIVDSATFGKLRLPVDLLAGVVVRAPSDPAAGDQRIHRLLAPAGETDRVVLENGDELTGTIAEVRDNRLTIGSSVGRVEISLDTVVAVAFNPALARPARLRGLRAWVGFGDGSRVLAGSAVTRDNRIEFKLAGELELSAPTADVVALQPLGGDVVYLSDLKAASYRHVPFLSIEWPYHTDRSVEGHQLRSGGRPVLKGLGMHSPARLTYNLDRPYRQFQAELAIDDEVGQNGSATFRVFVDEGDGKWQSRYASTVIRGGEPARAIAVDLRGAKRISLIVDYAERGDEQDHADWLNARLVK